MDVFRVNCFKPISYFPLTSLYVAETTNVTKGIRTYPEYYMYTNPEDSTLKGNKI